MENAPDCKIKDRILEELIHYRNEYSKRHAMDGQYKDRHACMFYNNLKEKFIEHANFQKAFSELMTAEDIGYYLGQDPNKITIKPKGEDFYNNGKGGYCNQQRQQVQHNTNTTVYTGVVILPAANLVKGIF